VKVKVKVKWKGKKRKKEIKWCSAYQTNDFAERQQNLRR